MKNEFTQDYAGEIALECEKLELAVSAGLEEYKESYLALGKSRWYSLALEDDSSDKEKDTEQKTGLLKQLVEKVLNFLRAIGKKIAEWFQACKAAVLKFFGHDEIKPEEVSDRFDGVMEGLAAEQVDGIISALSEQHKALLAEIFDKDYSVAFYDLYARYKHVSQYSHDPVRFAFNHKFFVELKEKAHEVKGLAATGKFKENADVIIRQVLTGHAQLEKVKHSTALFNEVESIHTENTKNLEHLLDQAISIELKSSDGDGVELNKEDFVKLVSDVIKIDGEIVMKVNSYMQALAVLMTNVAKYRMKRLAYIGM